MESTTWLVTGGSGFIGTNLIERLSKRGINAYNVDIRPPIVGDQQALWRELDICDRTALINTVCTVKPDIIVHLAAKADFDPNPESFYGPNVEGTRNLLDGALLCKVSRVILTSTQYVNGPLKPFADDRVYYPVNAYGESKVRMEQLARTVPYEPLDWVIIRPTNVWGPHHPRFPTQLWRYIKKGLYLQPKGPPIMRSYGYVGNVARQIELLAEASPEHIRHRVFYVGEPPVDSARFLDEMSVALRGSRIPRVPLWFLRMLALTGDIVGPLGLKAPINSDRYHRITTDHLAREETIWAELDYEPVSLKQSINETVSWLKSAYPQIYA